MNKTDIERFFGSKENTKCPITNKLIAGGYKQKSGGYIKNAKIAGVQNPTQYWHLIYSWCGKHKDDDPFDKRIQCGELIIWMAEVSEAVPAKELSKLCDRILASYLNNRRGGNAEIKQVCFDRIVDKVMNSVEIGKC